MIVIHFNLFQWTLASPLERWLVASLPNDEAREVLTTTQADMNVSSGKLGIKRLAAQSSLEKAIYGIEDVEN